MIGPPPICMVCKHLHDSINSFTCDAFPDGIPQAIAMNGADHRDAFSGDNGIRFEVKEGVSDEALAAAIATAFHFGDITQEEGDA